MLQQFLLHVTAKRFRKQAFHLRRLLTVPQVEVVGGAGGPQPHGVHSVVHVTGDGRVIRHRQDNLRRRVMRMNDMRHILAISVGPLLSFLRRYLSVHPFGSAFRLLHASVKVNRQHVLGTRLLPRVPMPQPIVCFLHLQGKDETLVCAMLHISGRKKRC